MKDTDKTNESRGFFITESIIFFIVVFVINLFIISSILSGAALIIAAVVIWIVTVLSVATASKYARRNSLDSDGGRKIKHYLKAWVIMILMALFSVGISFAVRLIMNFIVELSLRDGGNIIGILFFIIPIFVLYIVYVYYRAKIFKQRNW